MPRITTGRLALPATRRGVLLAAVGLGCLGVLPVAIWHLVVIRPALRLEDLDVYRLGGSAVWHGRALYTQYTPYPAHLPFTYPPFAALLSVPLAAVSLLAAGAVWSVGTIACTAGLTAVGFRALLPRLGRYWPVGLGLLAAALSYTTPFRDEIKFGQVDELLAVAVVVDLLVPRPRWPRGLLVGLAAAVKLEPVVFVPYLFLVGYRRAAGVAAATFVAATGLTWAVLPGDSADYWLHRIFQTSRLENNAGPSNQALRGMLLRLHWPGALTVALWLVGVALLCWVGYRRAAVAWSVGDRVAGVALVGLLSVLVSPVAWIHHLAWLPLAIGVLVGTGHRRRRVAWAVAVWGFYVTSLPWWGSNLAREHLGPAWLAGTLTDSFGLVALLLLVLLPYRVTVGDRSGRTVALPDPAMHTGRTAVATASSGPDLSPRGDEVLR